MRQAIDFVRPQPLQPGAQLSTCVTTTAETRSIKICTRPWKGMRAAELIVRVWPARYHRGRMRRRRSRRSPHERLFAAFAHGAMLEKVPCSWLCLPEHGQGQIQSLIRPAEILIYSALDTPQCRRYANPRHDIAPLSGAGWPPPPGRLSACFHRGPLTIPTLFREFSAALRIGRALKWGAFLGS